MTEVNIWNDEHWEFYRPRVLREGGALVANLVAQYEVLRQRPEPVGTPVDIDFSDVDLAGIALEATSPEVEIQEFEIIVNDSTPHHVSDDLEITVQALALLEQEGYDLYTLWQWTVENDLEGEKIRIGEVRDFVAQQESDSDES